MMKFIKEKKKTEVDYDNKEKHMQIISKLSSAKVYIPLAFALSISVLLLLNCLIVFFKTFKFSFLNAFAFDFTNAMIIYKLWVVLSILISALFYIKIRTSFKPINIGQHGTASKTDRKELKNQFKKVPLKKERFEGIGGMPVADEKDGVYVDDAVTNNLIIGITRSGKGELIVFRLIDIYSRGSIQPSMIFNDPKLELAQSSIPTLEKLGYECHILNLIDPEFSIGYNPLSLIIETYKEGDISTAEALCKTLCFSIYKNEEKEGSDPFWSNSAVSLMTALILAAVEDNLKLDEQINLKRKIEYEKEKQSKILAKYEKLSTEKKIIYDIQNEWELKYSKNIGKLSEEAKEGFYAKCIRILSKKYEKAEGEIEDIINSQRLEIHVDMEPFYETFENEKKINFYSIITNFITLANTKIGKSYGASLAIDNYFNDRADDNKAKINYGQIGAAAEATKGSIISSTLDGVSVFMQENIAKMTAKSTIDLARVGFSKKPIAIFLGLPDYDSSNHFIASIFIRQLYYILAKLATANESGKLDRLTIFNLDEFGNMPAIEGMDSLITVCLGRNIMFNLVIQSYSQIEQKYGDHASKTIIGNCGNHIYILTNDSNTAKEISERLGEETIIDVSRSGEKFAIKKSISESATGKRLLDENQLMSLKPGESIILRTMKRTDLKGKGIRPKPIFNLGEHRMRFRYEYLLDEYPSGQLLYRSANMQKIERLKNEDLAEFNKRIEKEGKNVGTRKNTVNVLDYKIETTENLLLKEYLMNSEEYVKNILSKEKQVKEILTDEGIEKLDRILNGLLKNKGIVNRSMTEGQSILLHKVRFKHIELILKYLREVSEKEKEIAINEIFKLYDKENRDFIYESNILREQLS